MAVDQDSRAWVNFIDVQNLSLVHCFDENVANVLFHFNIRAECNTPCDDDSGLSFWMEPPLLRSNLRIPGGSPGTFDPGEPPGTAICRDEWALSKTP